MTVHTHKNLRIFGLTLLVTLLLMLLLYLPASAQPVLMPEPKSVEVKPGFFSIRNDFSISVEGKYDERILSESTRFLRRLDEQTGCFFLQQRVSGQSPQPELVIKIDRPGQVALQEDESYVLNVDQSGITLTASTDIGAVRGLETLLQLVQVNEGSYAFPVISISDAPRFAWRGLMLDVARHFMPLEAIYRNLDAMAAVKLNVFHLHLSDDQGFRFESETYPKLTGLASDGQFYTKQELRELVAYAGQRGIIVIPEIDVPGHATAILSVYPELASKDTTYVLERFAGIFNPTLDPSNEEVYVFLSKLLAEFVEVFPAPYVHIGGDETTGKHWNQSPDIQAFMKKNGLKSNHDFHTYFNIRVQKILSDLGRKTMGWEEIMTPEMPKTALIHSWRGEFEGVVGKESLYAAAKAGYETILSNGYYLDLMQPLSKAYGVDPAPKAENLTDEERTRILGGEICMWSELVIPQTIDSRLWPYSAAIAERFWSPEEVNDVADMYRRLDVVSLRLEQLGLMHLTSPERILRKLSTGEDVAPLRTLLSVVEPMKGYTRNPGGTMYTSFSPYTLWADAATADAKVAREFNQCVEAYISGAIGCEQIKADLGLWAVNHKEVAPLIQKAPVLKEIEKLSENLSKSATVGLETIAYLEANQKPRADWIKRSRQILTEAKAQGGRTELQIVKGLNQLIDHLESSVK